MRARWRAQDLTLTQPTMSFLPKEAKRLRAQVEARINGVGTREDVFPGP
jgi:hypothetical protein